MEEESKPITTLPVETSLGYLKAYHGPARRANQPSSSRRDVKKVKERKCDTKMLRKKDLRTQVGQSKLCNKFRVGCLPQCALTSLPVSKAFNEQKNSSHKDNLLNQTG